MLLSDALSDEGYCVIEAGTVLEAIALLGQHKIDAVITDIDMPGGLSGLDLAKMHSATHGKMPVIIASGRHRLAHNELPEDQIFVPKPYGMGAIVSMVDDMMAHCDYGLAG